jgi:hypothetical protein
MLLQSATTFSPPPAGRAGPPEPTAPGPAAGVRSPEAPAPRPAAGPPAGGAGPPGTAFAVFVAVTDDGDDDDNACLPNGYTAHPAGWRRPGSILIPAGSAAAVAARASPTAAAAAGDPASGAACSSRGCCCCCCCCWSGSCSCSCSLTPRDSAISPPSAPASPTERPLALLPLRLPGLSPRRSQWPSGRFPPLAVGTFDIPGPNTGETTIWGGGKKKEKKKKKSAWRE